MNKKLLVLVGRFCVEICRVIPSLVKEALTSRKFMLVEECDS